MPRFHVSLPDGSEATHELTEDLITLGRVDDNAIQIDDASVSSHHAELIRQGEDYVLKDIGSTNGTRVNGKPAEVDEEIALKPGDRVIFGNIAVRYLAEGTVVEQDDLQPLPVEAEPLPEMATSSAAPTNFTNASPFQKKSEKKEPAAAAVLALGVLGLLAAGYAIFAALQMPAPM